MVVWLAPVVLACLRLCVCVHQCCARWRLWQSGAAVLHVCLVALPHAVAGRVQQLGLHLPACVLLISETHVPAPCTTTTCRCCLKLLQAALKADRQTRASELVDQLGSYVALQGGGREGVWPDMAAWSGCPLC